MELLEEPTDLTTLGGMVGVLNSYDESPVATQARVRPFVWSILLFRGAVRPHEVISSIAPHSNPDDLRCQDTDTTPLEDAVHSTLRVMAEHGILRLSDKHTDLYVLDSSSAAARKAISVTSTLDAQLPDHMLAEMGRSSYSSIS